MKNKDYAINIKNLTVSYGSKTALFDINLLISKGSLTGILGPNGAGKSTFIKTLMGFIKQDTGKIEFFGEGIEKAKSSVAYVPQRSTLDWDFPVTVEEVALMGRYGHIPWYKNPGKEDFAIVKEALSAVAMQDFAKRQIGELSGGQQQRVFIARALCQGAKVLLLDEPFAGVDAPTEKAILKVLKEAKDQGLTLLVVHHDLNTAADYFDSIALIKQGLIAFGPPEEVLREELLKRVYETKSKHFYNQGKRE